MLSIKIHEPAEFFAAITIAIPSLLSLWFLLFKNCKLPTIISAIGCLIHFPFSFTLHMHKAFNYDIFFCNKLFKFDIFFIHVHAILTGFSWLMKPQPLELMYHGICMYNIIFEDPFKNPAIKTRWDIMCGLSVLKSAYGMFFKDKYLTFISYLVWFIALVIHNKKIFKKYSSGIMHILLGIPQYCLLTALQI